MRKSEQTFFENVYCYKLKVYCYKLKDFVFCMNDVLADLNNSFVYVNVNID